MTPLDELAALLRPAGGGLFLVSTGRAEQLAMQRRIYGADDETGVDAAFRRNLAAIADARVVILGCPSTSAPASCAARTSGPRRSAPASSPATPTGRRGPPPPACSTSATCSSSRSCSTTTC
ncbi:hypothetical protein OV079_14910 [Nannocystis pusilla]|uniref:Uncharacterized protein n=1 Tax=Nannocystis pusilla TaxID=889268 RepID=A0A9X3EP46_9BACT|nr:hypothetical protein [Nannocystis pusilla]